MPRNLTIKHEAEAYEPTGEELEVRDYLTKRVDILKEARKDVLGTGFNFDEHLKEVDAEYTPQSNTRKGGSMFLIDDEIKGMRGSRIVLPRSNEITDVPHAEMSSPQLLTRVNTALSLLFEQNPEAVFEGLTERYKNNEAVAQSLWKRSWKVGYAKESWRNFVFDLAKYGTGAMTTKPRLVERKGKILTELDLDNPEKNKYKDAHIVAFNDIYRQKLDLHRSWFDDQANYDDHWSIDDFYYEKDYTWDKILAEFGDFRGYKYLTPNGLLQTENEGETDKTTDIAHRRNDVVTLGFYESISKDLFGIWSPVKKCMVYYSPLPNDEKELSLTVAPWIMRDTRCVYGVSLWELIKGNKELYDILNNMTIEQLVYAIYPLLFYTGPKQNAHEVLRASPKRIYHKQPGTTVDQVKVNWDPRGHEGIGMMREQMDEHSGITPALQGNVEDANKTLGEVLHAKESALKRLNIPFAHIKQAIETEAMIALSWMSQLYSIPEIREFTDEKEMQEFAEDYGADPTNTKKLKNGKIRADFLPVLELSLEREAEGDESKFIAADDLKFFKVGHDMDPINLKWRGRVSVNAQSILSPSKELNKERMSVVYNIVLPVIQQMIANPDPMNVEALGRPTVAYLEELEVKPDVWLPSWAMEIVKNPPTPEQTQQQVSPLIVPQIDKKTGEPLGEETGSVVPRDEAQVDLSKTMGGNTNPFRSARV